MKGILKISKTMGIKKGFFMVFLIIIYSLTAFIPIKFMQRLIDAISLDSYQEAMIEIVLSGILYMVFQLLSQLLYAFYNYYSDKLQNEYAKEVRDNTFKSLLEADELILKKEEQAQLSTGIIEDTQYIAENYYKIFVLCAVSIVNFLIGFVFMTSINLYLSLIIIPLGLLTSMCSKKIEEITEKNVERQKNITEKTWKFYSEGVRGIKQLKIFDSSNRYVKKIEAVSEELCNVNIMQSRIENFGSCIIGTLYMLTIAVIMLVSAIFVLRGKISFGGLLALVMYNHMLVDPLLNLIDSRQKMIKLNIALLRLEKVLTITKMNKQKKSCSIKSIIFDNVSFSYADKDIFSKFSMKFESNKKYCIIGKTGTGKSTLLNLIAGYLTPSNGKVAIVSNDGQYYYNIIPERISMMGQNGFLFNTTIEDNIRIANPLIDNQQLEKILSDCCLKEVSERVSGNIGDDGGLLSGGERKRVQLAICLAKNASDVIIFDELSSSLDKMTFLNIMNNISAYIKNKIVIFVEHYNTENKLYDYVIEL